MGPYASSCTNHCPIHCPEGNVKCKGGIDDYGCQEPDTCMPIGISMV